MKMRTGGIKGIVFTFLLFTPSMVLADAEPPYNQNMNEVEVPIKKSEAAAPKKTNKVEVTAKVRILFNGTVSDSGDAKLPLLADDLITAELIKLPGIEIVGAREISDSLGIQNKKPEDCRDPACLEILSRSIGAQYMVISNISRIGGSYVFGLKLVSIGLSDTKIAGMYSKKIKSESGEELLDNIPEAVGVAMKGISRETVQNEGSVVVDPKKELAQEQLLKQEETNRGYFRIGAYVSLGLSLATFSVALYYGLEAKSIYENLRDGKYTPDQIVGKVQQEKNCESVETFTLIGGGALAVVSAYLFYKGFYVPSTKKAKEKEKYKWMNTGLVPIPEYVTTLAKEGGTVFLIGGKF